MEIQEKTINLVFDKWNGNIPIPNGINPTPHPFFNAEGFVFHYLNPTNTFDNFTKRINCKSYNINDIKKNIDNKFFYIVAHQGCEFDGYLNSVDFPINDLVIDYFKNYKNLNLIFLLEHEGDSEKGLVRLQNKIDEKNLDNERIFVLNNNSLIYNIKSKNNLKYNVKKLHFLDYSSTYAISHIDSKYEINKVGKFFISRNKSFKTHRLNLIAQLKKENLLNDTNYSFIPPYDIDTDDFTVFRFSFDQQEIDNNKTFFKEILTNQKVDDYEVDKKWYDFKTKEFIHRNEFNPNVLIPETPLSFINSYVNIVTESLFDNQFGVVHITEKTFRPFYHYQIPIFLATPFHIKFLNQKYDFDIFNDIIDHSYDDETDDYKRFFMIINEIKKLYNSKDKIVEFYKNNQKRFELNRKKLLDIAFNKTEDFEYFWNLL